MSGKIWKILNEVLDLSPQKRDEALKKLVQSDETLSELRFALQNYEDVDEWWEMSEALNESLLEEVSTQVNTQFPKNEDLVGKQFGAYVITGFIAEGGMGRVFSAERNDGAFERKVALKLMSFHVSEQWVRQQFTQEQKILGSLIHPGIAQLYDASVTENGIPFFVMEWVDGKDIVSFANSENLDIDKRLELFQKVLEGISHAHKNLTVHQDIKPSNIIINQDGEPKILDFGISKIIESTSENEIKNGINAITLGYASPEQILKEKIGTSSDIYSLGVILFELICGRKPIDVKGVEKTRLIKIFTEEERPKLSELTRKDGFKGDLDSILSKALSVNQEDRYDSVKEFRDDIQRYLNKEVVLAVDPSIKYKLGKFLVRNKWQSTFGILFVATVLSFIAIFTIQVNIERRAALEEARKAIVTKDYLLGLFEMADPLTKPGEEQTIRDFLNIGIQNLSELDAEARIKEDASYTLAQVAYNLGDYTISDSLFAVSLNLNEELYGESTIRQAHIMDWFASIKMVEGNFRKSKQFAEASLEIKKKIFEEDDPQMVLSYSSLGKSFAKLQKLDSAEIYLNKAQKIALNNPESDVLDVATSLSSSAVASREQGDYEQSVRLEKAVIDLLKNDKNINESFLAAAFNNLGFSYRNLDNYEMAVQSYDSSLQILRRIFGNAHPNTFTASGNLAGSLFLAGDTTKSEQIYTTRVENILSHYGKDNWRTGRAYSGMASFYKRIGRLEDAKKSYETSIENYVNSLGNQHFWTERERLRLATIMTGNDSETLFRNSIQSIKTNLTQPLSYFDYQGIEALLEELNTKEQKVLEDELKSFLNWYGGKFGKR